MKSKWTKEKDKLENLILKQNVSYTEIGKLYNCSSTNIKNVARRLGINLPERRKINPNETFNRGSGKKAICLNCGKEFFVYKGSCGKYCCIKCQKEYISKEKYKLCLNGDTSIMRANYSPRAFKPFILKEQNGVCAICGMPQEWNGKPLIFILDHIDGNAANNKRDNLRCVCPNCDSQLDTYKSKNKNGARSYYRYHKYIQDNKNE